MPVLREPATHIQYLESSETIFWHTLNRAAPGGAGRHRAAPGGTGRGHPGMAPGGTGGTGGKDYGPRR